MKLFLLGSALLSGGVMASEGEVVVDTVKDYAQQVQNRFSINNSIDVQENGFPYPTQEFLDTLTDEQAFAVISYIDVANGTNDWQNMTDEELLIAVAEVREGLHDLYLELGVEGPMTQTQTRTQTRQGNENGNSKRTSGANGGNGGNGGRTSEPRGDQDGTCDYVETPVETPEEAPDLV